MSSPLPLATHLNGIKNDNMNVINPKTYRFNTNIGSFLFHFTPFITFHFSPLCRWRLNITTGSATNHSRDSEHYGFNSNIISYYFYTSPLPTLPIRVQLNSVESISIYPSNLENYEFDTHQSFPIVFTSDHLTIPMTMGVLK